MSGIRLFNCKHRFNCTLSTWADRKIKRTNYKGAKCDNVQNVRLKQCRALLQSFLLAVCEALLLQQKPGILNPQGSQWEGKASSTIPVLGACGEIQRSVNPEPLSLLRAWDSGQCFTMAPVHWVKRKEEKSRVSEMKRQRKRNKRDRDAPIERERQPRSVGKKHRNSHKHLKNRPSAAEFIELSCNTGGTQEWVSILHEAYTHRHILIVSMGQFCFFWGGIFKTSFQTTSALFKLSRSCTTRQEAILLISEQWFRIDSCSTRHGAHQNLLTSFCGVSLKCRINRRVLLHSS